jgi:hypothetical protein
LSNDEISEDIQSTQDDEPTYIQADAVASIRAYIRVLAKLAPNLKCLTFCVSRPWKKGWWPPSTDHKLKKKRVDGSCGWDPTQLELL